MSAINDSTILLTGATGGFGQELTKIFLTYSCNLILTDLDEPLLEKAVSQLQTPASKGKVIACIPADLSHQNGVNQLYASVNALDKPVDILINNAGIAVFGRHDEVPPERWEMLMQINLLTPMRLCAKFTPSMIARKKGHIVNISSAAGWAGSAGLSSYAASKFGLRGFSESLMDELGKHDVQITAVYPYFSRTPILQSERHGSLTGSRQVPDSELTDPADIMQQVVYAIENNQQHLFPDQRSRQIHWIKRFFPGMLRRLGKRLDV